MQRPQKIKEKLDKCKSCKNLLRAKQMLSWEEKSKKIRILSCFHFARSQQCKYWSEKAPKSGWNPTSKQIQWKTLKFMEISSEINWTFKCQIVNCSKNLYPLNFESNDVLQSQNQNQMSNQILTVCKLILNQSQFDMIIDYWWNLMPVPIFRRSTTSC